MSFRFRKRLRISPGLALNLSRCGVSASLGVRGAIVNVGRYGIQETMGLPGSGVSCRTSRRSIGLSRPPQSTRGAPHRSWFSRSLRRLERRQRFKRPVSMQLNRRPAHLGAILHLNRRVDSPFSIQIVDQAHQGFLPLWGL
jgi:uncharacterized protein DUF4236